MLYLCNSMPDGSEHANIRHEPMDPAHVDADVLPTLPLAF
jgi:hypothetical protein